ncbi:MAG: bifunctional (p)ppGpp synthetase/guanosine-3',5'-bis(diphosphate) 3'-pyrophosphohydrolase [Acidobacteria bacterium]|nr:bifunctional (p)ppGpp synthetase/guanosine-3',5'-bis(diphosphate) 3'-pyrophosphohydrolase [Acidobacteriota bacterium]
MQAREGRDLGLVAEALTLAEEAHRDVLRRSGEPYIVHPIAVAEIVAEQGLDDVCVISAILHDVVEDTDIELAEIEARFGVEIARVVDGVTKLDGIRFRSKEAQTAATMRKMLVAIAQDVRVLIIKLADRLHNMTTLAPLPIEKQQQIAQETLDVYAPLAHRLGMQTLRTRLEDLAFAALHPKWFAEIEEMVSSRAPERDVYIMQVIGSVEERLAEQSIEAEVFGRPKHLWSIYEKMVIKGRSFEDIFDLVGMRIIVENVRDCYAALGSIHSVWRPVQGRFKDYISMPKFNLYQSLHTTVIGPQGKNLEVQIRTREMDGRAEHGVAAHWDYKGRTASDDVVWMDRIAEWQEETTDPSKFMHNLKTDLEQDEVYVFTPKGDAVTLPVGVTPVDFAYQVHTEIGDRCIGARVNGRLVNLESRLTSGDTVEIVTSNAPDAGPSKDWLTSVVTQRAANNIKAWHSRERRTDMIEQGQDMLEVAMRRQGIPRGIQADGERVAEVATEMNYSGVDDLFEAVGHGHVAAEALASRIVASLHTGSNDGSEQLSTRTTTASNKPKSGTGVHVEGLDDVSIRLSRCCNPVPPDEIIGFVTRGRGTSVHRTDCANAVVLSEGRPDRLIDVEWDEHPDAAFLTSIEVKALDRSLLLRDVSAVLADHRLNCVHATMNTGADRVATMRFELELVDVAHLDALLFVLMCIDGVYDTYRVLPE